MLPEVITAPPPARGRPRAHGSGQLRLAAGVGAVLVVLALFPAAFAPTDPADCTLSRSLDGPSRSAPFGFDVQGCDVLTTTVYGTRTSLGIAALVVGGTVLVALVLGSLAGLAGGRTDRVVLRVTDIWSGIPLVLGAVIVLSSREARGPLQVALVLVLFGWPPMVRVLRASVLVAVRQDYVVAARALGARPLRLLLRHVLPNSVRPLVVFASAYTGIVIAAEATLTFAGVGLARPTQSWGIQLYEAQDEIAQAPHVVVFPGLFVVAAVTACVLFGEALRARASTAPR